MSGSVDTYLIIAICVIVVLAITFISSLVLYVKTSVIEEQKEICIDTSECQNCSDIKCNRNPKSTKKN